MAVLRLYAVANRPAPPKARFRCECGAWFAPQLVVVQPGQPKRHACPRCCEFGGSEFSEAASN